jgi:hypothetical protein
MVITSRVNGQEDRLENSGRVLAHEMDCRDLSTAQGLHLREVPGPLKMTTWIRVAENCPAHEESAASKIGLYVIPCIDGVTGLPYSEVGPSSRKKIRR